MKYLSENGIKLLKQLEGLSLHAYPDPATKNDPIKKGEPWTIGYGHTGGVKPNQVITAAEANVLLSADLVKVENAVNKLVMAPLNQNQFDALVIFCYNVGIGNKGFGGSTMLRMLNSRDYRGAAEQFIRLKPNTKGLNASDYMGWIYAGDKPLLINRRKVEKALFLKPV